MLNFLLLTAAVWLLPSTARAEDENTLRLDTTEIQNPSENPSPSSEALDEAQEQGDQDQRPGLPASKPVESRRFELDQKEKIKKWLIQLCHEDPVSERESAQRRLARGGYVLRSPKNKQGSLLLLLENYLEALSLKERCEKKQDDKRCRQLNVRQPSWQALEAKQFYASSTEEALRDIQDSLRKNFYEVRELSELNGKQDSRTKALAAIASVKELSPCQFRAVRESYRPFSRARSLATDQK